MKVTIWHATIGVLLVGAFFGIVGLVAYLLYGPGITVTVPDFFGTNKSANVENPFESASGALFECDGEKALKAEFSEGSVRLALSDGRSVILPQRIDETGAIRYENVDGSFALLNEGDAVSVVENRVATYKRCTAAE